MIAYVPVPKVPGDGGLPKDFNANEIHVFKGYFCKFLCQSDWDNFYEEQVFLNDQLKENARASYNNEIEKDFMEKIFDSDADYQKMTKFVIDSLVNQGLLNKEVNPNGTTYLKTSKLKALCPEISKVIIPSIDYLVEKYDKEHSKK